MDGKLDSNSLVFDVGQKWAKGIRISFLDASQSLALESSEDFLNYDLLKQIHSKVLVEWTPQKRAMDYRSVEADGFLARGDSFKSSRRRLMLKSADCAPLFYIDRENELVAALHAGWRGLSKGIHRIPFDRGFDPKSTWIWCGPSLNGANFEVGEDMWGQFPAAIQSRPEIFVSSAQAEKKFFHAWSYLETEFSSLGVELFYKVEIDTYSDKNFNSFRRWKRQGQAEKLRHNYSWIGFV